MPDFFVSYTQADRSWAEWIAWRLEELGYRTVLQAWDFAPGSNFVAEMQRAAVESRRIVAVLSPDYLARPFPESEWATVFARDPIGAQRLLIPVRVRDCQPQGLLAQIVYIDLVDRTRDEAAHELSNGLAASVDGQRAKPQGTPSFPGHKFTPRRQPVRYPGAGATSPTNTSAGFLHAAVSAGGLLDLRDARLPYVDELDSEDQSSADHGVAWVYLGLPSSQYLRASALQDYTPCTAVCTPDPTAVASSYRSSLGAAAAMVLGEPPGKLRLAEKVQALGAVGEVIRGCFVASIVLPSLLLRAERDNPSRAYHTICDLLLLPVAEVHRQRGFASLQVRIARVGEDTDCVLQAAKRVAAITFPRKGTRRVSIVSDDRIGEAMSSIARVVSWAVGAYYNNVGNRNWLAVIEEHMNT